MEKKPDFKAMSNKAKVEYIWDYYRLHIIGTICAIALVVSLAVHYITYVEPLLNVIMVNCDTPYEAEPDGFVKFLDEGGYGSDPELVSLTSSFYFPDDDTSSYSVESVQLLSTMIIAGGQDLFFGTGAAFDDYAEQGALMDLSEALPGELLEKYEDQLIYSTDNGESEPYPCAVTLTDNAWLSENHYYSGSCNFGIFVRTQNKELAVEFAEFLLEYPDTAQE